MSEQPDMIEQVGRMLTELADNRFAVPKLAHAACVAQTANERQDAQRADAVVALASAVLAVAAELRSVHNVLHEINMKMAAVAE